MVHPSELLRTNSNEARTFSAPRNVVNENQLDCGWTNLPIINRCCNLERFATPKAFLVFFSIVGFLQGVTLTYFRETAQLWGKHYNISEENVDWLIYTNEFLVGLFALVISYYGNRIHRISWLGGLTIFHAIAAGLLLVPEIYRENYEQQKNLPDSYLCGYKAPVVDDTEVNFVGLALLAIYQIFFAMVSISFISHGITYLDDNCSPGISPGYIGIALAFRELGKQAGLFFSWIPSYVKVNHVFVSPVWLCIASAVLISGILISMFPKNMPSFLIKRMAASLVDLASGHEMPVQKQIFDGFFKTVCRLLRNKILMVNIFCAVMIQSGLINFNIFEKYFNQSRFQVSYINDTSYTQYTTNILKQPLVAISLIATGFLVAKTRLQLKSLVKWNILAIILVILFFGSTAFLTCEPNTKYGHMLQPTFCSEENCECNYGDFQPVCMDSKTYYSPCYAACTSVGEHNSRKVFFNCGCNGRNNTADEGPCNVKKCDIFYALSQVNRVFTTTLLASTLVTNLIINMRCILRRDKATALGLEATFISLITYLPVKAIYGAVAENYCIFDKDGICKLYSHRFATFLSVCTIGFMVISLILAIVVLILLKLGPVTEEEEDDDGDEDDEPIELQEINDTPREHRLMSQQSNDEVDANRNYRKSDSGASSIPDSLLELENVGDDHDSIDSASHLDELYDRPRRGRIIESDL